jgi:hypothetical protein
VVHLRHIVILTLTNVLNKKIKTYKDAIQFTAHPTVLICGLIKDLIKRQCATILSSLHY